MAVITLSREPYSGGSTLADAVAKRLGYVLVTRSDLSRIFQEYGLITFDEFYTSPLTIWERLDEVQNDYMSFLVKVIRNIGYLDNAIIIGRGSFAVLAEFGDVLNIRLWAPFEVRVRRCMEKEQLGYEDAYRRVEREDRIRSSFLEHCFHVHHTSLPTAFDLVLNTGKILESEAAEITVSAVGNLGKPAVHTGKRLAAIQSDAILLGTIRKVLEEKQDQEQ